MCAARQLPLSYKTLPVTASHFDGTLEYNVHNLYSLYEVVATAHALQRLRNRRQFILTRCGAGRCGAACGRCKQFLLELCVLVQVFHSRLLSHVDREG